MLPQRSKHPREMVITPKVSTSIPPICTRSSQLWDCVPRVCGGGGGSAGGGVPLGAVPALSWRGEVSLGGILIIICFDSPRVNPYATEPAVAVNNP